MARRLFRATTRQSAPMNRSNRVFRASFYLSLAMPFAALACGDSFTAGPGDGGDDGQGIILGDAGGQDSTTEGGGSDAHHDGPAEGGTKHDASACPSGSIMCADGGCALEGLTNCGSCGNDCTTLPHVMNPQCTSSGQCSFTCAPGWQNCTTNAGAGCGTDTTKQGNCGACGVTCSGTTPVCGGTGCVSGCDAGQMLCNSSCSNTATDPSNCGNCGNVCTTMVPHAQPSCSGSTCGFSCLTDYMQCGQACVPATPLNGVTVAPNGDMTANCGAPALPCGTITLAIAKAQQLGVGDIFVAKGTYQDKVNLANGIQVHGGWVYAGAGSWSYPSCTPDPSATVIQSLPGVDRVVVADYAGTASLDSLKIDNDTTAATGTATTPGQSLYGIFAANSQAGQTVLNLNNVVITVAAGGAGGDGLQGVDGGAPGSACSVGTTLAPGDAGIPGLGATAGVPSASGYQPSTGKNGSQGDPGSNGSAAPQCGQANGPQQALQARQVVNNDYTTGTCCGTTCVACATPPTTLCGGAGTPGCGSTGSAGGAGGTGGGASIGVFVFNETVTINGTSIATAGGGHGGDGGLGGPVYNGSLGAPGGQSSQFVSTACTPQTVGGNPVCVQQYKPLDGGSPGGQGYSGGTGGQGGGGSGGDSFCWFIGTGATVNVDAVTTANCQPGPGGPGGDQGGGTSQGAPGASLPHN